MKQRTSMSEQIIGNENAGHLAVRRSWFLVSSAKTLLFRFLAGRRLSLRDGPALLADFEAGEAPDGDVLPQLADLGGDQLRDTDGLFLDEWLIEQAHFLVELRHL